MPPLKQVPSLFTCSSHTLTGSLHDVSEKFLKDDITFHEFTEYIETVTLKLGNILGQSEIAHYILQTADKFARQYESSSPKSSPASMVHKIQLVVPSLVSLAVHFSIDTVKFSDWSCSVQSSLLNYLWRVKSLKRLDCHSSELGRFGNKLLDRLPFLTNLTHFHYGYCTDELIASLCENCRSLESVRIEGSRKVTAQSIESLASLRKLQALDVTKTQITEKGLVKLLLASQSENLADILGGVGHFDVMNIHSFLYFLEADVVPFQTFNLHRLFCEHLKPDRLPLIIKYFPFLHEIIFYCLLNGIPDLSVLSPLKNLVKAELYVVFGSGYLDKLLSLQSPILTNLKVQFESVDFDVDIDLNSVLELGLHCPNLTSIDFIHCSFVNDNGLTHLPQRPFSKLKSFTLHCLSYVSCAETLLSCAVNIVRIVLAGRLGVTDEFFSSILEENSLSKLETLDVGHCCTVPTLEVFKHIINNCPKLTSLGRLFSKRSAAPKYMIEELKAFISQNNYNISVV